MKPVFSVLFFSVVAQIFFSCAPPTRDPFGWALLKEGRVPEIESPDSLRADLILVPRLKGAGSFSARLYAEPNLRYRLDAFSFGSQIAASYLWDDKRWTLLIPEKHAALQGKGDSLNLEEAGLRIPDIHALLGFLWGDPLPGFRHRDDDALNRNGDTLRWSSQGVAWEAVLDPRTGTFLEAHSADLALKYGRTRKFGSRFAPEEVEVFVNGESMLLLRVKEMEDHPVWKRNPFVLPVPEGYSRHNE